MVKVYKPSAARAVPWLPLLALAAIAAVGAWSFLGRPRVDPDALWSEAEADFRAGRVARAEAALAEIARRRPPTPLDHVLRAQVALFRNRPDEAVAHYRAVPDGHPMAPQARLLAGQTELRRMRPRAAEAELRAAVRLDPTLAQAHRELIYIYGMLLRRDRLNAEFRALSEVAVMTFDNVFHWCLTRNSVWEPKEMTATLRAYVRADPDDRWSRLALAENLRQVGERAESERVLAPLPDDEPEDRVIRVKLALDANDDPRAEALLRGGPDDHPELSRLRGRFALAHRDGAAALRNFRAAAAADPDHRDTLLGLGQALAMTGDHAAAAPVLARARDLDVLGGLVQKAGAPEGRRDPGLTKALGAACERVGRTAEARAWYALAIEADPLDTVAQKALYRLKARPAGGPAPGPTAARP